MKRNIIALILAAVFVLIINIVAIILISTSNSDHKKPAKGDIPVAYVIKRNNNFFEYQDKNESAGYASAYVLRSLGFDYNGKAICQNISKMDENGNVKPEDLVSFLSNLNIVNPSLITGTVNDLKKEVYKGKNIIAITELVPDTKVYHYITVVGYDSEYIYTFDSMYNGQDENLKQDYNRAIKIDDFNLLFDNSYIIIDKK